MATLTTRFTLASNAEGDTQQVFATRLLDPLTGSIEDTDFSKNWLGMGMGRGAAAMTTLANGAPSFVAGEGAPNREINEFGPFPGFAYMLFCYGLGILILSKALARARQQEPLALLLVPVTVPSLFFCVLEQPTEQGFMVISVAFSLAALKMTQSPVRQALSRNAQWLARLGEIRARRAARVNLAGGPTERG